MNKVSENINSFIRSNNDDLIETNYFSLAESVGLFGTSEYISNIIRMIHKIAPSDVPVLITGESGTGKDVVAKAIHTLSNRRNKTLVIVNSGAIAEGILESELFGHEKGAFTGAVSDRKGYFETADGGTIFLDEIGDTPLQTQVKLLRVLESGEYLKVGGSQVKKSDVRVIAATHRNLEQMVRRGEFRKDLYYRLKAITIALPSLRQRKIDIPVLVQKFTEEFAHQTKAQFKGFSKEAINLIQEYRWPGNIRELKNFIESLMALKRGELISANDVSQHLENYGDMDKIEIEAHEENLPVATHLTPEQAERELLYRTLLSLKRDVDDIKHFLVAKFGSIPSTLPTVNPVSNHDKKINDARIVETDFNVHEPTESVSLSEKEKELIVKALRRFEGKRNAAAKALGLSRQATTRLIAEACKAHLLREITQGNAFRRYVIAA